MPALEIDLQWQGPYGFASREQLAGFNPPQRPGVYLWTVGETERYQVSYVGQAANIQDRMWTHITSTLGGGYHLYGDAHLVRGEHPNRNVQYKPGFRRLLTEFLDDHERYSVLAFHNLTSYRMFWAVLDGDQDIRKAAESALISAALEDCIPIQNDRTSLKPECTRRVRLTNLVPVGLSIAGVRPVCEYGSRE